MGLFTFYYNIMSRYGINTFVMLFYINTNSIRNLFFISQQKQSINNILNDILIAEDIQVVKKKVQLIINLINK